MWATNSSFFMSKGPSTDEQLTCAARGVNYFRGVFSIDQLPPKPWKNESAIVNLQRFFEPGSHWVCYEKRGNNVRYFDSFGKIGPPREIVEYLRGTNITYNTLRHQSYEESRCGQLCILFLLGQLRNVEHQMM